MLTVLLFVMVDTVILTVVMALDNSRFSVTIIPNKENPTPHVNVRISLILSPLSQSGCSTLNCSCVPLFPPPPSSSSLSLSLSLSLSQDEGIKEISVISRCHSSTEPYWLAVLFGYKIIIQITGIIFAFLIRKVKIKGLNDSKEVSAILYITSVILAVILVVNFVLGDYIDVDGFVYGFGVATAVTIVLLFTFVPKVSTRSHRLPPFLVYSIHTTY